MKKYNILRLLVLPVALFLSENVRGQGADNLLNNPTDARALALGGTETALSGSAFSVFHNAAQLVSSEKRIMTGYSFLPWMHQLTKDMMQHSVALSFKPTEKQAVFGGFRYLTQPSYEHTDAAGNRLDKVEPRDYSIDFGYARMIVKDLSASLSCTYMRFGAKSNHKRSIFALNAGLFYNKTFNKNLPLSEISFGLQAANFGIADYSGGNRKAIPWILKAGGKAVMDIQDRHFLAFSSDLDYTIQPSNLEAWNGSLGLEYSYRKMASVRGGYHLGDRDSGYWRYGTCGLGMNYKFASLDLAYIISDKTCPLHNTWMVSFQVSI